MVWRGDWPQEFIRDGYPLCGTRGQPLEKGEVPTLPPPDRLVDEGFLALYHIHSTSGDAVRDEILRFTYGRMYESVTSLMVVAKLTKSDDPAGARAVVVTECSSADRAASMASVQCATMMLVTVVPREALRYLVSGAKGDAADVVACNNLPIGERLLTGLAARPPSVEVRDFLVGILPLWAGRDPDRALQFALEGLATSWDAAEAGGQVSTGLAAFPAALCRMLPEQMALYGSGRDNSTPSGGEMSNPEVPATLELLVDVACSTRLA